MALIVNLADAYLLKDDERFQAYGCLDATGTREIFDKLMASATDKQKSVYRWTMAQMGPAVTMGRRGILVDQEARNAAVKALEARKEVAIKAAQEHTLVTEVWNGTKIVSGKCFDGRLHKWPRDVPDGPDRRCAKCGTSRVAMALYEPGSNDQTARLLYDLLKVQAPGGRSGERAVDEDSLDTIRRLGRTLQIASTGRETFRKNDDLPGLIDIILEVRDCVKQLGFLKAPLCEMGRYHSNFRPHGTWTGRWSSKEDAFELGGNAQNITKKHRHVFIADPGMEMFYVDLATAESYIVAHLAGDEDYIKAHDSGDVHTYVCRLVWPELPWTGDLKRDKELAKTTYPEWDKEEGHDYRFQGKRVQHGSNLGLTGYGLSRLAHIAQAVAFKAQHRYFAAFPRIREWQKVTFKRTNSSLPIITPFGREICLMGRPWDEHTYKQALAYGPQSLVGDILNTALWNIWAKYDPDLVQVLAQVHDAILGQFRIKDRAKALKAIMDEMSVPIDITDIYGVKRRCVIRSEIEVGPNWGVVS